jgi:hypothetical protein
MSRRPWWQESGSAQAWYARDEQSAPWPTAPGAHPRTDHAPVVAGALADLRLPAGAPIRPLPEVQTSLLDLTLRTTDGLPCANVALRITGPDGTARIDSTITTDGSGRARLPVPDDGTYEILLDDPIMLPPVPAGPPKAGPVWSRKIAYDADRFSLPTGARHDVVVVRPAATEVILDGWAQASAVMRWGGMRVRRNGTVGTARASLARALWLGRGKTMLVIGHADPLGTDLDNEALSAERASSVALFVQGDLENWADHAFEHATEIDWACAMVACARILGLDLPGLDDTKAQRAVLAAVRAAGLDGDPLPDDEPPSEDDWRAVAAIYETDLAALLMTDRAGLAEIRAAVRWADPVTIAAGEHWPRTEAELLDPEIGLAGPPALMHRRVSLVVLGDMDGPMTVPVTDGAVLYDGTYARVVLDPPGEVLVQIQIEDPRRAGIAAGHAWISVGTLGVFRCTAAPDGVVRFPALLGDPIRVVAAFDADGCGTMVSSGVDP